LITLLVLVTDMVGPNKQYLPMEEREKDQTPYGQIMSRNRITAMKKMLDQLWHDSVQTSEEAATFGDITNAVIEYYNMPYRVD
jgi:hypothetical protein